MMRAYHALPMCPGCARPEQDLLADSNPMVVANAVAALADIRDSTGACHLSIVLMPFRTPFPCC